MADSGDVVMGGVADSKVKEEVPEGPTTLQLSALESQILELYDRMKELELDIALAKAQEAHYSSILTLKFTTRDPNAFQFYHHLTSRTSTSKPSKSSS